MKSNKSSIFYLLGLISYAAAGVSAMVVFGVGSGCVLMFSLLTIWCYLQEVSPE